MGDEHGPLWMASRERDERIERVPDVSSRPPEPLLQVRSGHVVGEGP